MATQPEFHGGDLSDAALEIPSDWLMPWLDLEAVRQAQRPDAAATLTADHLILTGVELVVERRWLREAYWRQVKQAIILGRQRISGPNGIQQKDDMENWFIQTRYSKGFSTRWRLRQNNQLGMSRPSVRGPNEFGLPGMFHKAPTDENGQH